MKINKEDLRQAFTEAMDEDIEMFLATCKDEDLDQKIKESKNRVNKEKIYGMAQKSKKNYFGKWGTTAAIIMMFLLVGTVTIYALEQSRQAEVQWKAGLGKTEDDFQFEVENPVETASPGKGESVPDRIERRYRPVYVTEGFRKLGENRQEQSYRIEYGREKERIYFEQMIKSEKELTGTELAEQKSITINNYEGYIGYKKEEKILRFETGQYVFEFSTGASVEWDEIIRMAESVSKMPPDQIEVYYAPSYVPEGYVLADDSIIKEDWTYSMDYMKDDKNSLMFVQTLLYGTTSIDSGDVERKEVEINGRKGRLNYKKKKKSLVWATNDYVFSVHGNGNISVDELLKVAESIVPVD